MNGTFEYVRADGVAAAVALVSSDPEAQYLAATLLLEHPPDRRVVVDEEEGVGHPSSLSRCSEKVRHIPPCIRVFSRMRCTTGLE